MALNTYRMGDIIPLIQQQAAIQGVDPKLAIAHFVAENTSDGVLNPNRMVSLDTQGIDPATGKPSGAVGLFQVVGTTLQGLAKQGYIPPDTDYSTLQGQVVAGVAAVKAAAKDSGNPNDPMAVAAQYVNGTAGTLGYQGKAPMPTQTAGYLPKIARSLGMTWSGKSYDPATKVDLNSSMDKYNQTMSAMPGVMASLGLDMDVASQDARDATVAATSANVDATKAAGQREIEKLNSNNQLNSIFNINPADRSNALIDSMTKFETEQHKADQMKPAVDALMSINPLANPVKWLAAQFQLGSLVPQYNATIQNRDSAADQIKTRQQLDAQQQQLVNPVTLDTIQADMRAKAELQQASGAFNLAKIDMENINFKAKQLSEQMAWNMQGVQVGQANMRLFADNLGVRADQAIKASDQAQLDKINVTRMSLGAPAIPTMQQFNRLPKDQQETLLNAATDTMDVGKSVNLVREMGTISTLQTKAGTTAMGDLIGKIAASVDPDIRQRLSLNPSLKQGEVWTSSVNARVKQWQDQVSSGDMTQASNDNPYKMNAVIYAKAPGLENNSLAKFVNGEGKNLPQIGEKEILANAIGQVKAGRDPKAVAQDVEDYFIIGNKYQFQSTGMGTLGFDPRTRVPLRGGMKEVSYGVGQNIFGWTDRVFGDKRPNEVPVQLMSAPSVQNFLVTQTVKSLQSEGVANAMRTLNAGRLQNDPGITP